MKRAAPLTFIFITALLSLVSPSRVPAQQSSVDRSPVTLYSDLKHRDERRNSCMSLLTGMSYHSDLRKPCDLFYGMLYAGEEKDWFQSSTATGNRSLIRDLGLLDWTATFTVPVVTPLPKLKPGEQRHITVDTSGADGADGAPGQNGADADGVVRQSPKPESASRATPSRPKNDGKPKVDSLFVKAVLGHLYVIHVVDDVSDFYALFRVEALETGDNCTISWKLIPAPESQATERK